MRWHTVSISETENLLQTGKSGLTDVAAADKLAEHGPNKLAEKKRTSLAIRFLRQFNDFMVIVLIAAALISLAVSYMNGEKEIIDTAIILGIVILNASLGVFQESKAEKSLEALKRLSVPLAKVLRGGKVKTVNSEELVRGDVIVLTAGDSVPADARLIESYSLRAEESALTGESLAVEKDCRAVVKDDAAIGDMYNMVFAGSSISYGRGKAIVVETGMNTEVGKVAHMIMANDDKETPLKQKLEETGKTLGIGALIICGVIFLLGIMRHIPPFQMFMTSVSLAVAAIPEGLPAIVTIMLALGVQRMAKSNAIIRKLPAVETLGSASVICSDKTGTLTQNRMRVVEVRSRQTDQTMELFALCNNAVLEDKDGELVEAVGEPTEVALAVAAKERSCLRRELEAEYPRVGEIAFDSERKLMTTLHRKGGSGEYRLVTKGAPDVLLGKCEYYDNGATVLMMTDSLRTAIERDNEAMAKRALRVIGVAYKTGKLSDIRELRNEERGLVFSGLAGMIDPPRPEAADAVMECKEAGIKPVMITGDHALTAAAIAEQIGIMESGGKVMTGVELNKLTQEELESRVDDYSVFARVSPEHKVRLVKAFQNRGRVVAMTGDGVNDAPALKAADIGCAMGINGTDVAKGAADMVLADDNFATIVKAIRQGRGIYDNIKKSVHFLLSSNIGEIITIFTAIFMGWDTPLLAIHLLWVNLVTDSLPAISLGLDSSAKDIMTRKPIEKGKGLFSDGLWARIVAEGIMIGMLALIAFGVGTVAFDSPGSHLTGRTMAFAVLSISQLFHAFNMRSEKSLFRINIFENMYLIGSLIIGLILQVSVISIPVLSVIFKVTPLSLFQWGIVAVLSISPIIIVELQKLASSVTEKPRRSKVPKIAD